MAPERLSRLQRRLLAWLAQEEGRTRGTMAARHQRSSEFAGRWSGPAPQQRAPKHEGGDP